MLLKQFIADGSSHYFSLGEKLIPIDHPEITFDGQI